MVLLRPKQIGNYGGTDDDVLTLVGGVAKWQAPSGTNLYASRTVNTAPAGQTVLTLGATPHGESLQVFKQGLLLTPGVDYTHSGTTVTLTTALTAGQVIVDHYLTTTASPAESVLSATYSGAVLADSPWGFWRLTETSGTTLADSSPNSRPLTLNGSAHTLAQAGPKDKAVAFANAAGYAISSATHATSPATLEGWVYLTANPGGKTTVVGCADTFNGGVWDKDLYVDTAGKAAFYLFNGTSSIDVVAPSGLSLNTWHHLAATVGAAGTFLYVDGVQVATDASTASYAGSAQKVLLRASSGSMNNTGAMRIAEPAFFTSQLSAARIAAHYSSA